MTKVNLNSQQAHAIKNDDTNADFIKKNNNKSKYAQICIPITDTQRHTQTV